MTTSLDADPSADSRQALAALLAAFDEFCARARARLIQGHGRYRDGWKHRDNLTALLEECEDAFCYGFFDWLRASKARGKEGKARRRGQDP